MAVLELIMTAFATGIGAGIGTPIGNWIHKKYFEKHLDTAHEKIQNVSGKIKNGELAVSSIDTEEKIKRMLGK